MANYLGNKPINGTFGMLYWNGDPIYEIESFEASIKIDRDEQTFAGQLMADSKMKGLKGEGKFKIKKVFSRAAALAEGYLSGKDIRANLIAKLADPDAFGSERISFGNVWFNTIPLINIEKGKTVEEEYDFGFTEVSFPDKISVQ